MSIILKNSFTLGPSNNILVVKATWGSVTHWCPQVTE